jgi:UDP-3-O-[3-hydroxymyristoyl] glucosamine N-acyltransferase
MGDPRFFAAPEPVSLADIAALTGAQLRGDGGRVITGVAAIEQAGPSDLAYLDNAAYAHTIATTRAAALVIAPKLLDKAPPGLTLLVADDPYRVFAQAAAKLYPASIRSTPAFQERGIAPGAFVHPDARLEQDVTVDPGAVIGSRAEIGSGSVICANAVIGPDVRIGRGCSIGPGSSVVHALIGNRVTIHAGARIGQDGFGYAMGKKGHLKVPQIGRVIIQDDVDIGANTCVDRGSTRDTIIGEGTKIDNLVMIAHNVVIGRHCVIVSQVGISGSTTLGDFVVLAGQVGIIGHLDIGSGAVIGAQSGVMHDVPAGSRIGGSPALPMREYLRITALLRKMGRKGAGDGKTSEE